MKHKIVRVKNLMYKRCADHWGCVVCSTCIPVYCYTEEEVRNMDCPGVQELTFNIPKGKAAYARDMRRAAELLQRHGEL